MLKTSEWVSLGHPDKLADYISSYILDRFIERDPATRYAVEVQIKDQFVTLAGEVTSKAFFADEEIAGFVREAIDEVGYDNHYKAIWGADTICGSEVTVAQHIGRQSPDIARGVDADGWGDQGIFWGMAVANPDTGYMPEDWYLAREIGEQLYNRNFGFAGHDIKTQVTMRNGSPEEVVVAIPLINTRHSGADIMSEVDYILKQNYPRRNCRVHVNGTGVFTKHGPVGDCGTTGRKLAVDFYGGNCRIGGGSPWTKDGTKADLTLNLYARSLALVYITEYPEMGEVYTAISCRIGSPEIRVSILDAQGEVIEEYTEERTPAELIERFKLNTPKYAMMCREGLFYEC